ncbi:MAG: uroporphyrinogen decarboxylase family protein [Armatimonadota bacterium]
MNHKERFYAAVDHKTTDRPPTDFIAEPLVIERIVRHMGTADYEAALAKLDIDIRHINHNEFRPAPVRDETGAYTDIWGVRRRPVTNQFGSYDEVDFRPLAEITSMDQVEKYPWPSPDIFDFITLEERCKAYQGNYAIVLGSPGIMDLINSTSFARGMELVLMDIGLQDPVGLALMEKRQEFFLEVAERALKAAKGLVDVLWIGDDYGTQTGQLINPNLWKQLFGPKMKAFVDIGHKYGARVMLHSCGSNRALLPLWIDMGLDIFQAVQVEAEGMEAEGLFRDFGRDITFHGMIGLQSVLSHGSSDDVRREVEKTIRLSGGSGYVVSPTHFLEIDVPMENAQAIYDSANTIV